MVCRHLCSQNDLSRCSQLSDISTRTVKRPTKYFVPARRLVSKDPGTDSAVPLLKRRPVKTPSRAYSFGFKDGTTSDTSFPGRQAKVL